MVKELIVKTSSRELAYRTEHYHDIRIIKNRPITCTSCGNKVIVEPGKIFTHPVIGTLLCEKCWDHCNNIDFSSDEDHVDKYCRLCAHEKNLYICGSSNCIFAFCKRCIKRNAPLSLLDIEKNNWKCFICEPKPLWELRAVCASIMDCLAKRNKKTTVRSEFRRHDSVLPHKRYQTIQVKKMQKALQSICDDEEEEGFDKGSTENRSLYQKSIEKGESNITTKKSTTSKSRTINRLCSTTSSSNSSDNEVPPKKESSLKNLQKSCKMKVSHKDDSTSDTKLEVQHKTFKTIKNQQQKKIHLENTRNLSLDDLTKTKSLKVLDTYMEKKSKDKTVTSSCSSSDNEQSEPLTSIKLRHNVVSHDNKSAKMNSDSESDEENIESNRKKCKMLFNKSNKKKCYIKQPDEQDKKNVQDLISQSPIEIDTNSSSGREFQRTKLVRSNYDLLRKKQNKKIHNTSSKKNIINKQQYKYLKSNIIEILDELKQQCSVFELQAQHIENKCKKKPMYMEDANKIIYKSKSTINKLMTEFSSYEKHLMNFYKTFISSIKEEGEEEHESSEDDTILINKKPHKRKSSDTINKDNSKCEIVSDCDSEIFSGNETFNLETTEIENNMCENEIPVSEKDDQCSSSSKSLTSKDATDNIVDSVESRINQNVSPILGKQQGRKNLLKLSDNAVVKCNINDETCIENDDPQNVLTGNCMDSNITKCDTSKKELENKDNEGKISPDISNKLITAISSNDTCPVINDSLNDIFESSLELDNEVSKSNTTIVTNKDTHDLDTNDIQKENNETSNTECNAAKEDTLLLNEKELDPLREEEQDNVSIFHQETQKLYESSKSSSESEKTQYNEYPSQKSEVDSSHEQVIETLIKQVSSELDSDASNISDVPFDSTKVCDKSEDSLHSINQNELQVNKGKKHNDNESDSSTIISPNLNKSASIMELTLDNVKQQNSENRTLKRSSSEETNFLDEENNDKIEECIKNALLESDSNDSIPSSFNKETEINTELQDTDSLKMESTTFDNESTKSDELHKSKTQINNNKSNKRDGAQKRNYDLESDSSVGSRVKRRRLQLHKNYHYMNDKKLRMTCHIQIEILQDHILNQYKDALQKSKEHQNNKKIKRLINLDTLEKPHKKRSSATSKEDNKLPKSLQSLKTKKSLIEEEEEDSLMDHLKKVQDGDVSVNAEDDSDNNEQNLNSAIESHSAILTNDDLMLEADKIAKDLLLNSSDSNLDDNKEQQSTISDKEEEELNEKDKSIKQKEIKKEVIKTENEELSAEEKKKQKKRKSKWRRNKILTMKISDSESEKEREKWEKSQNKLKIKEEDSDKDNISIKKKTSEHKRKKNRRIFDSDSDVKEVNTDTESNLSSSSSEVMILSDSDDSSDEKQKKKQKQNAKKSSDTESSVAGTKQKPKRRRIKNVSSDSNSDSDKITNSQGTSSKSGRKNIRKVLKDKQVAEDTKQAAKEEEERLKRIMERQKLYNEMYEIRLAGEEKVEKLVLDFDPNTKEELISVHKDLVKRLKPHQAEGIKFMWDACFESLERIKTTSGSGCIIAHCMGLGKTLQVITLSHTLLSHEETGVKTILVVCPLSTVLNWVNEFDMWLKDVENGDIDTFELTKCKKNFERKYQLQQWHKNGGVLIIGYEMFRNLTRLNKNVRKHMKEAILKCLIDPGPDLIVCDEGHLLKNEDTAISKCMKQVKTLRRIVLTGTPLQNNLIEYHCMVQFVKPNLLGTKREFLNRFVNPITNGQFDNSTEYDVKLMKKRAHVLHKLLQGSIQRFDYSVLTPFLPPKQEYVIFVRLTDVQIKLYQYYLDNLARHLSGMKGTLFPDFQALQRIWTHPVVLRLNSEKVEKANEKKRYASDSEGSLKNFVVSDEEETTSSTSSNSDSDVQSIHSSSPVRKRKTRSNAYENDSEPESVEIVTEKEEWWSQFVQPEHFDDMRISTKLVLLFGILKECEKIGDKVLVFSQSLYSLTLIEQFLSQIDEAEQNNIISEKLEGHTGSWSLGLDYFRLDGQTSAENRSAWCKIFNRASNTRGRLFLISTRAGGLGINLTAANRVIIFDASWNPSHDIQSIFRVYRFGQKKPCYVYRFLAAGTMEEKIYNRQVTKLSLSCRVVDEQQIERHYSHNALNELYKFEPHTNTDKPTLNLPKDRLLAEIFLKYKDLVENYHEHDSLLENKADEELDEEERKQAWLEYEEEKKGPPPNAIMTTAYQNNILLQQYNNMIANLNRQNMALNNTTQSNDYENLQKLIEKDYPNATPEQRKYMTARALVDMYNYWEQQAMVQPSRNPIITQNVQQKITTPLGTTNMSAAMNQNLLRQQLLQNQQMIYGTNNTYTNVSNPPLKNPVRVINPYAYPKASTSNVQPRTDIAQITIDSTNTADTSAKTSTVPTSKEQEE
ncbi:transcriptional regulator ATRX-like isoform X1 [Vespa crabro]|uniref:transcriptional regulator ATRX-like isoform X1 n=1 Tax=Vespa crabro TaxID=7445 RepID=UPI001F000E0C|nr:transcriptional regulator ATRX-like isoform X1 [Vespa crabro]